MNCYRVWYDNGAAVLVDNDLGSCYVWGCARPAVAAAAPNVHYCARHAALNPQATHDYMDRLTAAGIVSSIVRATEEARRGVRAANFGEVCCCVCADGVLRPTICDMESGLPILHEDHRMVADADGAIRRCECGAWQARDGIAYPPVKPVRTET